MWTLLILGPSTILDHVSDVVHGTLGFFFIPKIIRVQKSCINYIFFMQSFSVIIFLNVKSNKLTIVQFSNIAQV